jgi:hypothetical protein
VTHVAGDLSPDGTAVACLLAKVEVDPEGIAYGSMKSFIVVLPHDAVDEYLESVGQSILDQSQCLSEVAKRDQKQAPRDLLRIRKQRKHEMDDTQIQGPRVQLQERRRRIAKHQFLNIQEGE